MRTLVHLSDIHFGRVDYTLVDPLVALIQEIRPDLVVVSGDFTQRARAEQFKEARAFLKRLPTPQIVVPGNHDVPLYNAVVRFLNPLGNYRKYITEDLEPFFQDNEIAVVGVNTTRSLTRKDGRINRHQVQVITDRLGPLSSDITKIVVTHHPFDLPPGHVERDLVGRARMAMESLAKCGADLFLSGHLHLSHTSHSSERYKIPGYSALIVQAGTTISNRGRGEANAFNVITIDRPKIKIERYEWQADREAFTSRPPERFSHTLTGWVRLPAEAAAM